MALLVVVLFTFFGITLADENDIMRCLKTKSVNADAFENYLANEDLPETTSRSQKCLIFCILKEAVEPPFMFEDGNMDMSKLKEHLLSIAESKYQKNEIVILAEMCAKFQNDSSLDECQRAYNFVTCFKDVKIQYCHSLFPCGDGEGDDCHSKWSDAALSKQLISSKSNYTTATDWLRDREEVSKCRFFCMSRMLNFVNAAVIMNQRLIAHIAKPYHNLVKKRIESAIKACAERNELDPCEKWYQFARCQVKLIQDLL